MGDRVKENLKYIIPAAVVAVLLVVAAIFFFRSVSPLLTVSRAIGNLGAEAARRLDETPVKALGMLADTLEDGTFTINFGFKDDWLEDEVSGEAILSSRLGEREFAIVSDISAYGGNASFDAYINRERAAARLQLLDDNFYGFRYSTFREDVKPFGGLIGLDDEAVVFLANAVDALNEALNRESESADAEATSYSELLLDVLRGSDISSRRARIESGGAEVRCTRVGIVLTMEAFLALMDEVCKMLDSDDSLRTLFDAASALTPHIMPFDLDYDGLLGALREYIEELQRGYSGGVTLTFYTGQGDSLLRFELSAEFRSDRNHKALLAKFDFGAAERECWMLDISAADNGVSRRVGIVWYFLERSGRTENIMTITPDSGRPTTLMSSRAPDSGVFTASFNNGHEAGEITGAFVVRGDVLRLRIDDLFPASNDRSLMLEIVTAPGASIRQIVFINLDEWPDTLVYSIYDLIDGFVGDVIDELVGELVRRLVGDLIYRLFGNIIVDALGDVGFELVGNYLRGFIFDLIFDVILGRELPLNLDRGRVLEFGAALIFDSSEEPVIDVIISFIGDSIVDLIRDLVSNLLSSIL